MAALPSDPARVSQRQRWLQHTLKTPDFTLQRASHDAGFRSYWRVSIGDGRMILMDSPPDLEPVAPWLRVHALLEKHALRVPKVLAEDRPQGFLLLEDLGPKTCLDVLTPANSDALMNAAIAQLLRFQAIAPPTDLPDYDSALLQRDVRLFDEWFLRHHLHIELDTAQMQRLFESYHFLIESARAQPQILVHRDFMLRNLMPVDADIAVIDFQGAVRGPISYDITSLTQDAFISWPKADVERWRQHYHQCARAAGLAVPEWAQFQRDAELIGVHRHIKVLGIFSRLAHRDGKPRYIKDAARFVEYLDTVVPRYPELAALDEILALHVIPVFGRQA